MYELADKHNKEEYKKSSTGMKQLHCIVHHYDFNYKELTSLKHKKQYFQDMIPDYTHYNDGCNKLMLKFSHDTKHIKPIEEYKSSWFLNYDVDVIKRFWYEEEEASHHHVVRRCGSYKHILKALLKICCNTKTT